MKTNETAMKLLASLLLAGLSLPCTLAAQGKIEPLERIGIRRGGKEAEFFLTDSKAPFFVTGLRLLRAAQPAPCRNRLGTVCSEDEEL